MQQLALEACLLSCSNLAESALHGSKTDGSSRTIRPMRWLANTFEAAATQAEKLAGLADMGAILAEAEANFGELLLLKVVLQQLQVGAMQALP